MLCRMSARQVLGVVIKDAAHASALFRLCIFMRGADSQ